jgi:hypothetical protein
MDIGTTVRLDQGVISCTEPLYLNISTSSILTPHPLLRISTIRREADDQGTTDATRVRARDPAKQFAP